MLTKKLDYSFYQDHTHLKEALDNYNGTWDSKKTRGYGVVVIQLNNLTFAIPIRSRITHNAAYLTVREKNLSLGSKGKGLDFTKALLITDQKYISREPFRIPNNEFRKIQDKEFYIIQKFEKYVAKYIKAMQKKDQNILNQPEYRHSTLINYHAALGLTDESK